MNVRSIDGKTTRSVEEDAEIDLALAVLCVRFPGRVFTIREIAEITGMSHGGPYVIEQRALKKLRTAMRYTTARQMGRELVA